MNIAALKELGLSEGEVRVYSAILEIGISTINKIHEKTGIERRNIYDIINKLIEKGLISYTTEKGKRTYQCANPNRLLEEISKKEEKLQELKKQIPDITKVYESSKPEITAEIFRGKEGIKAIFEDMLGYKEIYWIGGRFYIVKELPHYWPNYNKRRIKAGVKWHNLVLRDAPKPPTDKLISFKVLPKDFSGSPAIIFAYGNKVGNILWSKEFFAFVMESKEIAENYKRYHKYLWDNVAK